MPCAVVKHEALDQPRVRVGLVLHLHDFDHMQVDRLELVRACAGRLGKADGGSADGQHGIDNGGGEGLR
jgi:hypothetical protein